MTKKTNTSEDWMNSNWRPMMGWTYMATCIFDFILGPILYNILQYYNPGQAVGMWVPLTLQGGGLYHMAMGAIVGVSAYGRTQEKINGVSYKSTQYNSVHQGEYNINSQTHEYSPRYGNRMTRPSPAYQPEL